MAAVAAGVVAGVAVVLGSGVALALVGRRHVVRRARGRVVTDVDAVDADVAVVLGSGLRADGTPTHLLARRVEGGVELWRRGRVERLVMSGANDHNGDEPGAMAAAALALGVPAERIELDPSGVDTAATWRWMAERHGRRRLVAVTQEFHAARTAYLGLRAGLDAVVYAVPDAEVRPRALRRARLRELPASIKAIVVDVC
ncbi:MAG: ElyC/SanA/YdcF family protein [Acidimicrobiales bacterium]